MGDGGQGGGVVFGWTYRPCSAARWCETKCGSYLNCGWPLVATLAAAEGASLWEEKICASKIPGWPSRGVGITTPLVDPVGHDVAALAGLRRYGLSWNITKFETSKTGERSWEL